MCARRFGSPPFRSAAAGFQFGVLEFPAQLVVLANRPEAVFQSQDLQNAGIDAKCDGRIALFNPIQGLTGYTGALRNRFRRVLTAQAGLLDIVPGASQKAGQTGKDMRS